MNNDKILRKKNNLANDFIKIALEDLKYSNNVLLKDLILGDKIKFKVLHRGKDIISLTNKPVKSR
jgi:hypothetical protein